MKKGLLTLLAASIVFVGCQNYDDQFDDLNAQISALKSQVDGLASLSGQVASLSGTISGLQAGVNAAQAAASAASSAASAIDLSGLSASLTALQAEVDSIQASIATTSTAAAVAALETDLAKVQADLADLLASSNVYTGDLTINSSTTLNTADALGNQINIINGNVNISPTTSMDAAKLQTVIDKIFTVNGTWNYTAPASSYAQPTFKKLLSTGAMTITPSGDIRMDALTTAGNITVTKTYESKIGIVHFGALTTVGTLSSGTADNFAFAQATELHLTSLPYYNGASATQALTLQTKKGGVLAMGAIDDVTAAGTASNLSLTITGPASFTSTALKSYSGTLSFTNVATVNVSGYSGTIDVNAGVSTLDITGGVNVDISGATDLATANINIINDDDPTKSATDKAKFDSMALNAQSLSFNSSDLTSVTVSGELADVTFDGDASGVNLTNLDSITITADMDDLLIDDVDDLTSLTVTGAAIGDITITDNDKLAALTLDATTNFANNGATAATKKTITITGNQELASATVKGATVGTLTVTSNAKLATVDFSGLTTIGAAADFDIYSNALVATKANDTSDGSLASDDATIGTSSNTDATDLGSYTTTSGINTLKTALLAVRDQAAATANVYFDSVSLSVNSESGTETQLNSGNAVAFSSSTADDITTILRKVPTGSDGVNGKDPIKAMRGFLVKSLDTGGAIQFTVNGVALFDTTTNGTGTALDINGQNKDLDVAAINSTINTTRATNSNVTLLAKRGGESTGVVTLKQYSSGGSTATILGQKYTTTTANAAAVSSTNYGVGLDDLFTLTVGGTSVTASIGGYSQTTTTLNDIASTIQQAWAAVYGAAGTSSTSAVATLTTVNPGVINVTMLQEDSAGYGVNVDFGVAGGTATTGLDTSTNANNIDYVIGSSTLESDDATTDASIIVTIESTVAGVDENTISSLTTSTSDSGSTTIVELATTYTTNSTFTETYATRSVERTDVRTAEDGTSSTAATAAVVYSRVHWLG